MSVAMSGKFLFLEAQMRYFQHIERFQKEIYLIRSVRIATIQLTVFRQL